jgi:selenide,water dikinase
MEEAREVFSSMRTLNRGACEAMIEVGVDAATDVTGFGLLGHGFEVAEASGVSMIIRPQDVRVFPLAKELAGKFRPGAIKTNREFLKGCVRADETVDEPTLSRLYDPQTSGGLLIAVDGGKADTLLKKLRSKGADGFIIGEAVERNPDWVIRVAG